MSKRTGAHALLDQFEADGVSTIYGNPGTFEQGLLDALAGRPRVRYVMGLQEAAVVAMAINAARLSKSPSVVQLHASVGLGNAIGALIEAKRSGVPLLVYAGENSAEAEAFDGFLAGDLVDLARPAVKWAVRASVPGPLLHLARRAWRVAATPPRGPVLLSVPMDVLDAPNSEVARPTDLPVPAAPDPGGVATIAEGLARSRRPIVLIGDEGAWGDGLAGALALAEKLGALVYGAGLTMVGGALGRPCFGGLLSHTHGALTAEALAEADVVLALGASLGEELFPLTRGPTLAPGARLFQVGEAPGSLGKNEGPALALVAEPGALARALMAHDLGPPRGPRREAPAVVPIGDDGPGPLTAEALTAVLAESLPRGALVLDEGMTNSSAVQMACRRRPDVLYQGCLSRGLGSAWPAAVPAKLLRPERPVVAVSADGAAMYVVASLWTAAHLKLDVVFLTLNNRSYRVLKLNLQEHRAANGRPPGPFPPMMDLDDPPIQFAKLAEGMGLTGRVARDAAGLRAALADCGSAPGPHLIDALMRPDVPGEPLGSPLLPE